MTPDLIAVGVFVFLIVVGCGVFALVDHWHDCKSKRDSIRETDEYFRRVIGRHPLPRYPKPPAPPGPPPVPSQQVQRP